MNDSLILDLDSETFNHPESNSFRSIDWHTGLKWLKSETGKKDRLKMNDLYHKLQHLSKNRPDRQKLTDIWTGLKWSNST